MIKTGSIFHFKPTSTYFVEEKSILKIGEQEYESLLSYNIYLENVETKTYDIIINRTQLKLNEKKIDTKFLHIADEYMSALFPLKCTIEKFRLKILNLSEIKRKIMEENKKISERYSGEGIEHIQNQFLNATETDEKLSEFIEQLPFMKILNFGMQKFEKKTDYFLKWNILPIGFSQWKGKMSYFKDDNKLLFQPKIVNAQEIMNEIINYIRKNEYNVDFEEENIGLYADFKHEIKYTGETGRMKIANTEVSIEIEKKFFYQQKVMLSNK